jgi:hypothetical protein
MVSKIITHCDFSVITLNKNHPLQQGKSENKLLLFLRMGMPTIVTAIPSYIRVMKECGLDTYCNTENDWIQKIEKYIVDPETRRKDGTIGKSFTEKNYNEEQYLNQWDHALESVFL